MYNPVNHPQRLILTRQRGSTTHTHFRGSTKSSGHILYTHTSDSPFQHTADIHYPLQFDVILLQFSWRTGKGSLTDTPVTGYNNIIQHLFFVFQHHIQRSIRTYSHLFIQHSHKWENQYRRLHHRALNYKFTIDISSDSNRCSFHQYIHSR